MDEETGEYEMMGVIPEHILPAVLGSLNISYDFIVSDIPSVGTPIVNGTWPGDLGLLQSKVADMCVGGQYIDFYRFLAFCPLESYQRVFVKYLASAGKQHTFDFFTFLYQIDRLVLCLFLTALAIVLVFSALSDTMKEGVVAKKTMWINLWKAIWIFLASIFCEGSPRTMSTRVSQQLQLLWLFVILVLVNVLYGQFKGILLVQKEGYLRSMEDLADASHILPMILPDTIQEHVLRDSPSEAYQHVHMTALSHREECFIEISQHLEIETYQMVKDGTHVLCTVPLYCKFFLREVCDVLHGNRKFYFINEEVTYTDCAFLTNWGFPEFLRTAINERLMRLKEGGFVELWFSKYYWGYEKCEQSDEEENLLRLKHLHTAFYLYFYLLGFSIIVCVLERFVAHILSKKK